MTHQEETNGKLLSDEEVKSIAEHANDGIKGLKISGSAAAFLAVMPLAEDIPALLSDREARIQRNREGIEKMFAKMCELDTPKRGELHLLLISLFS